MFQKGFWTAVDGILTGVNDMFGKPVDFFCRLETQHNEIDALVADDGSLVTLIELHGALKAVGTEEFALLVDVMSSQLTPYLKQPGHVFQVVFDYDRHSIKNEIATALKPSRMTAELLGIDIGNMLDDWENKVSQWCASERTLIALWTRPDILTNIVRKEGHKAMVKGALKAPLGFEAQRVETNFKELIDAHNAYTVSVMSALKDCGLMADKLDTHTFLYELRRRIDEEVTSENWVGLLPGDPLPIRIPDFPNNENPHDFSSMLYPKIGRQIMPREAETIKQNILRIGNTWHATVLMAVPPQTPQPFNALFKKMLNANDVPWRMSMLIEGGGMDAVFFRSMLASVLHFASTTNKRFNLAMDNLKARDLGGEAILKFKCVFTTLLRNENNQDRAVDLLTRRMSELIAGVQAWGKCDASTIMGDPLHGFSASLPGLMPASPAIATPAPMRDVVTMLPMTRPASVWRKGSVLLRTPDGKIMPYAHNSSQQASWIDLGVAPMGGGKSVFLNTFNFGFVFQGGLVRLPWLSILDVGPSSSGLINLIRSSLPQNKKYLATYQRIRNSEEYSINPFDTPLGCRKPFPAQLTFLVNLVSLFATELDKQAPQDGISAIARACIEAAYEEMSDNKNPRVYIQHLDKEVDQALARLNTRIEPGLSWWDVVDILFEAGYLHEAVRAQRYAVPTLNDVSSMAKRDIITGIYKHETSHKEPITDFFWRSLVDSIAQYPILRSYTRFDIGDAQIISLDLDEVAPRGGPDADKQTGVMYMIGRQVTAGRFFMMPADVRLVPDKYKDYHEERINNIRQDPKRLCYDEAHRISRSSTVSQQIIGDLETSARESRKWNLSIGLYSQSIDDYPPIIIELATSIFILGAGTPDMARKLTEKFGLNATIQDRIMKLGQPGNHGANLIGVFKTSEGQSVQSLTNTIGPQAMWAFSSTTEDVTVRNRLYDILGIRETLVRLAKLYPAGSLKKEAERRKMLVAEKGIDDDVIDVLSELVREVVEFRPEADELDLDFDW